jgi:hypothetical protein
MLLNSPELLEFKEFKDFIEALPVEYYSGTNLIRADNILDPPEVNDLYFLYKHARESMAVSIMEFGSGYSTLVYAFALHQNFVQFGNDYLEECVHPNPFRLLTIDFSEEFQALALKRIPKELQYLIVPHVSDAELFELGSGGPLVTRWKNLPNFTPDLIYIDGPDPEQIKGNLYGYKSQPLSVAMSADILAREFFLWSGTQIILDGRGANAELLRIYLKRNWHYLNDRAGDRHIFQLETEPWGYFSFTHKSFKQNYHQQSLPWLNSRISYLKEQSS